MDEIASRLRQANSTMELVNVIITTVVPRLELSTVGMVFVSETGAPTLGISGWSGPESLRRYLTDLYKVDPAFARVMRTGDSTYVPERPRAASCVMVPLRGVGTIVGIIQFWTATLPSEATRKLMDHVAMLASLRLAELGITRRLHSPKLAKLTPRQAEIARLVVRGEGNQEVAEQLGITVNTVKKSLKLVFHTLRASNRTELASMLDRSVAPIGAVDLPEGYHAVELDADPDR